MHRRLFVSALVLTPACGGSNTVAASSGPGEGAAKAEVEAEAEAESERTRPHADEVGPPAATACRPAWADEEEGRIAEVRADATGVAFRIVGDPEDRTLDLRLDLETGAYAGGSTPEPAATPDRWPSLSIDGERAKVCRAAGDCFDATVGKKPLTVGSATVSPDGSTVALLGGGEEEGSPLRVAMWDVASGKRTGSFDVGDENYACTTTGAVALNADRVAVNLDVCAGPGGEMRVYDRKGKRAFSIGDGQDSSAADANSYDMPLFHVEGDRWAMMDTNAAAVWIHDVATGELEAIVPVAPSDPTSDELPVIAGPMLSRLVALGEGRFAAILGTHRAGDVAVVDARGDAPRLEKRFQLAGCAAQASD